MVTKIHRDALRSEIASLRALLEHAAEQDPLGSMSLQSRLTDLEAELAQLEGAHQNIATVALVFDGEPVRGSSAIEADFAGRALQDYQDLIAKQVALDSGQLAERGRLPEQIHQQARMNVTSLMHGSFGFVLEEDIEEQPEMFETAAQRAVHAISDLLREVAANDGSLFEARLPELDVRIFKTLKRFVSLLHKSKSTLKVAEDQRELKFDSPSLQRAFERVSSFEVDEHDETLEGELLGLVPIQRRFEFRRSDNGEVVQGRVAPNLSADYLERLDREGLVAGGGWRATLRTKVVHHPDGRHSAVSHTLIDLLRL
ncbi:hypothetical protein [Parvibaculum sp.]|uniref:hypothetical protein n=1 Tax=Parvibaculum sp. TaxID=2024848 RepID=UPI001B27DBCF|nr:hypothetical protein [Parvibaculum sp.]MBO6666660.1 hypothetical protein [Parvibaculum sp.]MBO6691563.1 hypothetical protein [Parvibaculum sp.]MBO6713281.1 hypothetical protein [Parvibaculum sp.]